MQYVFLSRKYVQPKVAGERSTRQRSQHSAISPEHFLMWELVGQSVIDLEGILGFEVGIMDVLQLPTEGMQ